MNTSTPLLGFIDSSSHTFEPLQEVRLFVRASGILRVENPTGQIALSQDTATGDLVSFLAAGPLGTYRVRLLNPQGTPLAQTSYTLDAHTALHEDTGRYEELFHMLRHTMTCYNPTGMSSFHWHGKDYPHYVAWILDHSHTAKGMQYFADATRGIVELLAQNQREDGLIWSWIFHRRDSDHFLSAYGPEDYAREIGDDLVVGRQPVENHCEYNFVDAMHTAWKASGDLTWLATYVDAAIRALNYAPSHPYRFSSKYQLLIRAFTIDSWDFQADDPYFINRGLGSHQRIDHEHTKFGVFFGDNHGYADACDKLAEMLRALQRTSEADSFAQRATDIRTRLDDLVWNGSFFRQRLEEDPSVQRDFGVDLDSQVTMSNLYALNRGIHPTQKDAIIAWYQNLRNHLPSGSPGEWYSIYPPFEKPFSSDCKKWEYMNAGVHAHAAGELVRGAYQCGHEDYATDVLNRLLDIGRRTQNHILAFAYTGAHEPPPPPPTYTPIDLSAVANMDILIGDPASCGADWMLSHPPFDMINLPSGDLTVAGAPYHVLDRNLTHGRVATAIGPAPHLPESITIPIHAHAAALRLAHCSADHREDPMAALLTFLYSDGSHAQTGLYQPQHVSNWWYIHAPETPTGGTFWKGPDSGAVGMGIVWTEIPNPHPERQILSLRFDRVFDGTLYALLALTLASAPTYIPAPFESYGGPDNWSGGLIMAALQEGLIGIQNAPDSAAYQNVILSPRWTSTNASHISATTRLAASNGYLSYNLHIQPNLISGTLTSSASNITLRLLLPTNPQLLPNTTPSLSLNHQPTPCHLEWVHSSPYAVATLPNTPQPIHFQLTW